MDFKNPLENTYHLKSSIFTLEHSTLTIKIYIFSLELRYW